MQIVAPGSTCFGTFHPAQTLESGQLPNRLEKLKVQGAFLELGTPDEFKQILTDLLTEAETAGDGGQKIRVQLLETALELELRVYKDAAKTMYTYLLEQRIHVLNDDDRSRIETRLELLKGNVLPHYIKGIADMHKAAIDGPVAQYFLGTMYLHGCEGLKKDVVKAFGYFKKSADQEYSPAAKALSQDITNHASHEEICILYREGKVFAPNGQIVLYHLEMDEKQGNLDASCRLGKAYLNGDKFLNIKINESKGIQYLKKAATQGHTGAIEVLKSEEETFCQLGKAYLNGDKSLHIPKNESEGIRHLDKAVSLGNAQATLILAKLFEKKCNDFHLSDASYLNDLNNAIKYYGILDGIGNNNARQKIAELRARQKK